jgi:hypothetical protein
MVSIYEYGDRTILQEKQENSAFFAVLEESPTQFIFNFNVFYYTDEVFLMFSSFF